jgi:hypothetical protein
LQDLCAGFAARTGIASVSLRSPEAKLRRR